MTQFILRRILSILPVLLLVSFAAYALLWLVPGDAAVVLLGPDVDRATVEKLRTSLGLDRSLMAQYGSWLGQTLQGDLGRSLRDHRPISAAVLERLPATVELSALAMLVALTLGIPAGIMLATRRGSWVDLVGSVVSLGGVSMPNFWLGILLIIVLSVLLGWLPPSGYVPLRESVGANLELMIMPAITLGLALAATVTRQTRASVLQVLDLDYVRTARAKGAKEARVIGVHVLKNALIPVITIIGLQIGRLAGGAVITETIFGIPGVGRLAMDSLLARDFPVIQAVVLLMAVAVVLSNLLVDVLYAYLDPRIRYG
jgi:peptide/nickel transport system permease protein